MKIGILSDAHGNWTGFKTCFDIIVSKDVDKIFYLGDIYGYGLNGNKIANYIFNQSPNFIHCLMGNHDAMMLGLLPIDDEKNKIYRLKPEAINDSGKSLLMSLLPYSINKIGDISILFVHGTPHDPLCGYLYENDSFENYLFLNYDYIFMGQTHRPYIKKIEKTTFINVGSCGLPRDVGNRVSCVIFDTISKDYQVLYCYIDRNIMKENFDIDNVLVMQCINRGNKELQ